MELFKVVDIFNHLLPPQYLCFYIWFSSTYYLVYARSDTERLQSLTEKQAQQITENTQYIKELEDRERVLVQNVIIYFIKKLKIFWCIPGAYLVISDIIAFNCYKVEELLMEIKETEAEVARWREACELEVEAGKKEMGERDKVVKVYLSFDVSVC